MSAQLLDGKELARTLHDDLKARIAAHAQQHGAAVTLAVLQVGEDPAAAGYARAISRTCGRAGVDFRPETLPAASTQAVVAERLAGLNQDRQVHGIMILEPLPPQVDANRLIDLLDPAKDVDGVHPVNAGRLSAQRPPYFVPATPLAGMRLLEEAGVPFTGQRAVMVGRSDIVGKPMALLLLHRHCTVTIAHSRTQDLPALCREADILCVAIGRAEMVQGEWVKPGAVVVDFGTTYTDTGVKGDCAHESVAAVAGLLTPVPGGVGPVTNIMLLENLLAAARWAIDR